MHIIISSSWSSPKQKWRPPDQFLTPPCSCEPHSPLQNELWGPTLGLSRTQHACEHITHSSNHSPAPVPRSNRAYHGRHAHGLSLLTCQAHRAISIFCSFIGDFRPEDPLRLRELRGKGVQRCGVRARMGCPPARLRAQTHARFAPHALTVCCTPTPAPRQSLRVNVDTVLTHFGCHGVSTPGQKVVLAHVPTPCSKQVLTHC